ncbi:MAG: arylsulfatase [Phycisphaerae bacterium]
MLRPYIGLLISLVTAVPLTAQAAADAAINQPGRKPNVIVLFPDQLRWASLGCYGDPVIRSPSMDRLAAEGIRFTHAFSNHPVCSPARSILLSGRYSSSNGVLSNQNNEAQPGRPTNKTSTLAETLGAAGYLTALVGKWHLAPTPKTLGFQYSVRPKMRHRYYRQTYFKNEGEPYVVEEYSPHHETEAAIDFIREKRDRPFFLYLSYGPPHMPVWEMPEKYRRMYDPANVPMRKNAWVGDELAFDENWFKIYMWDFQYYENKETFKETLPEGMDLRDLTALYYGQITAVDDCIGRVLTALKESGMEEDTIVVLTSDHGDLLGSHGLFNKNRHYDEAARIPMIVRYPRRLKRAVIDRQVVSLVDVMPTVLELCGVKTPASVQGTSVAPVLLGEKQTIGENAAFIETGGSAEGVRTLRYCYYVERNPRQAAAGKPGREHLFDVEQDPFELKDLAGDPVHADVLRELRERTKAWRERTPKATVDQ